MLVWYLKKQFFDFGPDIEAVNIHYAWSPRGRPADWSQVHEVRAMPQGGVVLQGLGQSFRVDEEGAVHHGRQEVRAVSKGDPNLRIKVLKLPRHVWDPERRAWVPQYDLHHYFEILTGRGRVTTDLYTEEIHSVELEYTDWEGKLCGTCVLWSVYDWDASVFSPTEDARFLARYGEDHELRSVKLYHHPDQPRWHREKYRVMHEFPKPWRWRGRIYGPRGAVVHQKWHIANLGLPEGEAWEDWVGETEHVMAADGSPPRG